MFWRGIWYLQNIYLLPASPTLSAWCSALVGTVMLLAAQTLRSTFAAPFAFGVDTQNMGITPCVELMREEARVQKENENIQTVVSTAL